MDLENQKRVKDFAEQYGPENVVVILGAAEGEAAGLAAETVTAGVRLSQVLWQESSWDLPYTTSVRMKSRQK